MKLLPKACLYLHDVIDTISMFLSQNVLYYITILNDAQFDNSGESYR